MNNYHNHFYACCAKNPKGPEFSDVRVCDSSGKTLEEEIIIMPAEEKLYICGNYNSGENVEIDARLYENIEDIRHFELQDEVISPGSFQFVLFPDFNWKQKLYYLKIFKGRVYVLETMKLDFSK